MLLMNQHLQSLYNYGYEIFGNKEKFHKWLERECNALDGKTPNSLLTSNEGIELVRQAIGRIEHGIFG